MTHYKLFLTSPVARSRLPVVSRHFNRNVGSRDSMVPVLSRSISSTCISHSEVRNVRSLGSPAWGITRVVGVGRVLY